MPFSSRSSTPLLPFYAFACRQGIPANGSGCQPSSLPGYTCSVQLSKNAYTLHWAVYKDSTVSMAAQVATTGFVGIGFSKDGKMTNSGQPQ
ncbi:hypothetical protein CLOP_g13667 [Closterium sp. NIES-67]|nr:hypothetical protein CLOP_g13667 [Closterium sp. NIES-67]